MPLPIGHSLSAYAIYDAVSKKERAFSWRVLLSFVFITNLPDFDFLPGYLIGNPNLYHRSFYSHSIGASLIAGAIFGSISSRIDGKSFWFNFCLFTGLYFLHVVLDVFSVDTSRPYGVPMFWPFSKNYIHSPVSIFMAIQKSSQSQSFLQSLFVRHNILAALWEFIVFLPVMVFIKFIKSKNRIFSTFFHKRQVRTKQVNDNT